MTRLKFYYDLLSQPCRALYIVMKINNIPFESCLVDLRQGEHLSEDFKNKVSRFQKVPVLHDNNFKLTENVAIIRYLAREFPIEDRWYPKDSKKQALVDEYLEWQHNNTRTHCALYFLQTYMKPMLLRKEVKPDIYQFYKRNMEKTLEDLEELWMNQGHKYITGDTISYADILCACELEQPRMAGYNPFEGRPKMAAWYERVKNETNPFYQEAHVAVEKMVENYNKKAKL